MTRKTRRFLDGFRKDDSGSAVVPFALWTPVFLALILSSVELGTVTIRHTMLERGLDRAVRGLRLNNGGAVGHDALKQQICDKAAVLPNCTQTLHLEMVRLDMFNWIEPPAGTDCADVAEPITPVRNFSVGSNQELMLLRACYKYRPITPAGTISSSLSKDASGYTALVATTAFVHEPS